MSRLQRRVEHPSLVREQGSFNPDQHELEAAIRGRTSRKVRAHLRRMDPVVLTTPRWSEPQAFLEDLALDLAVGEPALGCRTVSFRPLKGRPVTEAWHFVMQVLAQLSEREWTEVRTPSVADRRGLRTVCRDLLLRAQDHRSEDAHPQVALLGHGAEHLPVEVVEDLGEAWARFAQEIPHDRRATLLLAGSVDAPALALDGGVEVGLQDFGEAEAAATLVGQAGPAGRRELEGAARFTGGIPALVTALGHGARGNGAMPSGEAALLRAIGPLADEIRYAVDIASGKSELADRLDSLRRGDPLIEVPELDRPLALAGLLKRVRLLGEDRVLLRAPAIAAALG